ncbi:MAG: Bax inhibitor-1/YccA family protein [Desulfobulbaceae bacterium]|nr:MAG: Bax inhibitor-1/YccA family protein [Desulfobulbaceae bacterium]
MQAQAQPITIDQARRDAASIFLAKVFNKMTLGLGITGVVAYLAAATGLAQIIISSPLFLILALGTLGLVFFLSARIDKISATTAYSLFFGYAVLNGFFFSSIFLRYTGASIASTFLIAAGMFGAMAVFGMVTKRDLSGWGSFLFMGLIGIIIAFVVNIFLQSAAVHYIISMIGVLVFTGLTAYDVQHIKRMGEEGILSQGQEAIAKGSIIGALRLYLDFINLFIMLLTFFGGGRD